MLTDEQRRLLLRIARVSIDSHLAGTAHALPADPTLPEASGLFVTIKHRGALRGCLGTLQPVLSLADEVARVARDSATRDPRFPPLAAGEWLEASIEISLLGPLEPIDPADEQAIVIGRHGLVVESGRQRGLLLPQVAVEWSWTPEQFLRQTCRKAGLHDDAWQDGAIVFRFTADVFAE
jgi:AmmeMemoRadiSam system protein A